MQSPIFPWLYNFQIKPFLNRSVWNIFSMDFHSELILYRLFVSHLLIKYFGLSEAIFRVFSTMASVTTLVVLFVATKRWFGEIASSIATFLFAICHYSLYTVEHPRYGAFIILCFLFTIFFLIRALEENKWSCWFWFGVINFFNLTNVIVGFGVVPVYIGVGVVYFVFAIRSRVNGLKSRFQRMALIFLISNSLVIAVYYFRGLNFFQTLWSVVTTGTVYNSSELRQIVLVDSKTTENNLSHWWSYLQDVFLTLSFEVIGGSDCAGGSLLGYSLYISLFLVGYSWMWVKHRRFFWYFLPIFVMPAVVNPFVFGLYHSRYVSFILPFYHMVMAVGICWLGSWIAERLPRMRGKLAVGLGFCFLLFSWWINFTSECAENSPLRRPIWSNSFLNKTFHLEGIKAATEYINSRIRKNDVLLNAVTSSELLTMDNYGNALGVHTLDYYLRPYMGSHALDDLVVRDGKVGVWLILTQPLDEQKPPPFYFPYGYVPKLEKAFNAAYVYHGVLDVSGINHVNFDDDKNVMTPFWSFMKGMASFKEKNYDLARKYFLLAAEFGYNLERVYYNLGAIASLTDLGLAINYFQLAIDVIESELTKENSSNFEKSHIGRMTVVPNETSGLPGRKKSKGFTFGYTYEKRNGVEVKKMSINSLLSFRPSDLSFYYWSMARALYIYAIDYKQDNLIKPAKYFFKKGLVLDPNNPMAKIIKKIVDQNSISLPWKFKSFPIINLLGARESYPHL